MSFSIGKQGLGVSSGSPSHERRVTLTLLTKPPLAKGAMWQMAPEPQTLPCLQGDHPERRKMSNRLLCGDAHMRLKPCDQNTSLLPFSLSYPPFFPHSLLSVFPVILPPSCFSTACSFPPLLPAAPFLGSGSCCWGRDTAQVSSF